MRKTARLVGLMTGTALVAFLGSSCAESPLFASRSDSPSATIIDRALNAARVARANGDLNAAASKLAYLVSVAPDNADVLSEYGKVLTEMGQPDEALVYFKKAKEQNADDWKLYNAEGVAYDEKHDFEAARADYQKALELNSGSTAILNNAARSRMMAGDLVGAETLLAQAHPTAQEDGYFTSTQAQLSALELKSNSNAPVAALTPKMDVQAPALPPSPAPTLPVEVQKTPPVASAAPRTIVTSTPAPQSSMAVATAQAPAAPVPAVVAQPTMSAPAAKEAAVEASVEPIQAATPELTKAQTPAVEPAASPPAPVAPPVATSTQAIAPSATPAAPAQADTAPSEQKAPAEQTLAATPAVSAPVVAAPAAAKADSPSVETASVTPAVPETEPAAATAQPIGTTQIAETKPASVVEAAKPAPVIDIAKPAPVIETAKSAPVIEPPKTTPAVAVAKAEPAVDAVKTVPAVEVAKAEAPKASPVASSAPAVATPAVAQAPAAPAPVIAARSALSGAAQREAALEAGVEPPVAATQVAQVTASEPRAPAPAPATNAQAPVATETLYIRIGLFRSRGHAHHVAARLHPRDVHVTRVTWHHRHWYRVWIRGVGDRPEAQDELASVHSLGYLHARIIAKLEAPRHMARGTAPTVIASSGK